MYRLRVSRATGMAPPLGVSRATGMAPPLAEGRASARSCAALVIVLFASLGVVLGLASK